MSHKHKFTQLGDPREFDNIDDLNKLPRKDDKELQCLDFIEDRQQCIPNGAKERKPIEYYRLRDKIIKLEKLKQKQEQLKSETNPTELYNFRDLYPETPAAKTSHNKCRPDQYKKMRVKIEHLEKYLKTTHYI